jgi:DNA-directed RNA polymerase beta subunit
MEHRAAVAHALLSSVGLYDHHVTSYNLLVEQWLKDLVLTLGKVDTEFADRLYSYAPTNYRFARGAQTPSGCHQYNMPYVGAITVDVREQIFARREGSVPSHHAEYPWVVSDTLVRDVRIADMPIMLLSRACYFSEGHDAVNNARAEYAGGFIVRGKRRFIPLLQRMVTNYPLRFRDSGKFVVQVRSDHLDRKHRSTSTLEMVLEDKHSTRGGPAHYHGAGVRIPYLPTAVPLAVVCVALGWRLDRFVLAARQLLGVRGADPVLDDYCTVLEHDHRGCTTAHQAAQYIDALYRKTGRSSNAAQALRSEVLPHLNGTGENSKCTYLAYMFGMLVMFKEGRLEETDRDDTGLTRLLDSGSNLAMLFRLLFKKSMLQGVMNLRRNLNQNKAPDVRMIYNHERLTPKIISAVATGRWSENRNGVSDLMKTTNEVAVISQLRQVSSALNSDGKHTGARQVHPSACGYMCAAETPEGKKCGLVGALASFARVSAASCADALMAVLTARIELLPVDTPWEPGFYLAFDPHGRPMGWCADVDRLCAVFARLKRSMALDPFATAERNDTLREWRVHCDAGRMVRPLLVVDRLPQLAAAVAAPGPLVANAMAAGCLEYVAPGEERLAHVGFALRPGVTHLEVNDIPYLGIAAALAPWLRHNQGPRLVYWAGMSKQTICKLPKKDTGSATSHSLWYGQRMISPTQVARSLGMDQTVNGTNLVVAMVGLEDNQEDALVLNRAAVDRGLFVSSSERTYTCENSDESRGSIGRPDAKHTFELKSANYKTLQKSGVPRVGQKVCSRDIVIGRTVPVKKPPTNARVPEHQRAACYRSNRRDRSLQVRENESGVVGAAYVMHRPRCDIAKVTVRTTRRPEVGDKFSPYCAQKGCVGRIEDPVNLPTSIRTGVAADVYIAALCIGSRMTMGLVLEMLLGKAACVTGDIMASFDDQDFSRSAESRIASVEKALLAAGFSASGAEPYMNGETGEPMEVNIMTGCLSYTKLQHMVATKSYARATGPVHPLTRQPNEGRRQGGGMRVGEMEFGCGIAHGAAEVVRQLALADKTTCYLCGECGMVAEANPLVGHYFCRTCGTRQHVRTVELSYVTKLLSQELQSTGILPRIGLTDVEI